MSDAPERIFLAPEDAAMLGRKYGHPELELVCVGDDYVAYVRANRIEALEDEVASLSRLATQQEDGLEELSGLVKRQQKWLAEIKAENARLRDALEAVVDEYEDGVWGPVLHSMNDARSALANARDGQ